jgi:hypothetical protein
MTRQHWLTVLVGLGFLAGPAAAAEPPKVGDAVWAQWRPNNWQHGKADKATAVGLHVTFDDGNEADLPAGLIAVDRAPKKADVPAGARVVALWTDDRWYPGTVGQVAGGKYSIRFDDGDERDVELAEVRPVAVKSAAGPAVKADDAVWAQRGPNSWQRGKAAKKTDLGFNVTFDDGDADLPPTLIAADRAPKKEQVKPGARVLAMWTDGNFYPGTVTRAADGGEFAVQFDDGDTGTAGPADLRLLNQ